MLTCASTLKSSTSFGSHLSRREYFPVAYAGDSKNRNYLIRTLNSFGAKRMKIGITGKMKYPNIELHFDDGRILRINGRTGRAMGDGPFNALNTSIFLDIDFFQGLSNGNVICRAPNLKSS